MRNELNDTMCTEGQLSPLHLIIKFIRSIFVDKNQYPFYTPLVHRVLNRVLHYVLHQRVQREELVVLFQDPPRELLLPAVVQLEEAL